MKKLVLAGGGHAHLETLTNLKKFGPYTEKIVISPDENLLYSGMAPGLLEGRYSKDQFSINIKKITKRQGASFIKDRLIKIEPEQNILILDSGKKIKYDLLSVNTGSITKENIPIQNSKNIINVKPIDNLLNLNEILNKKSKDKKCNVAVIGAGAAGVEIAATMASIRKRCANSRVTLFSGGYFLPIFPKRFKDIAFKYLLSRNIKIESSPIKKIDNNIIQTGKNEDFYEIIVVATGTMAHDIFIKSGIPASPYGDMKVNNFLQSIKYKNIFGGGDCIYFENHSLVKAGVHAVKEGKILYHNLLNFHKNKALKKFIPEDDFLQILNLGKGEAVLKKKRLILKGRSAFILKDLIDKNFIRKFKMLE